MRASAKGPDSLGRPWGNNPGPDIGLTARRTQYDRDIDMLQSRGRCTAPSIDCAYPASSSLQDPATDSRLWATKVERRRRASTSPLFAHLFRSRPWPQRRERSNLTGDAFEWSCIRSLRQSVQGGHRKVARYMSSYQLRCSPRRIAPFWAPA